MARTARTMIAPHGREEVTSAERTAA